MNPNQIIVNWKEFQLPEVFPRFYNVDLDTDFIITITGPRRGGKTYFCFQLINNLLQDIPKENILYINFEDNQLIGATANDLDKLLDSFFELYDVKKGKIYLFLDEIQTVKDWDAWVRKINDTRKDIKIILTGSSSKLLSKEISTRLRGRVINTEIFPLSFTEILSWKKIAYNVKTISYSTDSTRIKKAFSAFLTDGGYPAAWNSNQRDKILQNYYDSMILKDVLERYRIEDAKKLHILAQLLFQSMSSEISYARLANRMQSLGFKIIKSTIIKYLSHFEDAYLFFQNLRYEYSLSKQLGSIKKVYCVDNGMAAAIAFRSSENNGRLLENLVFIELKRRGKAIFYHRKNFECDFIIVNKGKVSAAIQVTTVLNDETEKREFQGLLEAMQLHNLDEGIIITEDQEETRKISEKKIVILPAWKWMLTTNAQ